MILLTMIRMIWSLKITQDELQQIILFLLSVITLQGAAALCVYVCTGSIQGLYVHKKKQERQLSYMGVPP